MLRPWPWGACWGSGLGPGVPAGEGVWRVLEGVWRVWKVLEIREALEAARSGSTGFRRRFREGLVLSQVRFNRVPEKVPEKVWEGLVHTQVGFNRVPEKIPEKVAEKVPEEVLRKKCKNKTLRQLGIPPKLVFTFFYAHLFVPWLHPDSWFVCAGIHPKIRYPMVCNLIV